MIYTRGRNQAGNTVNGLARTTLVGTMDDYTYKSLVAGTRKGWAPSNDRYFLADLGITKFPGMPLISYCGVSQPVRLFGTSYTENINTTGFYEFNENLTDVGTAYRPTVGSGVFASVKSQIFTKLGITESTVKDSVVMLNFMPVGPQHFALLHWRDGENSIRIALAVISSFTGSLTNSITSAVVGDVSSAITLMPNATWLGASNMEQVISVAVYKGNGGYYIGGQSKVSHRWTGNGGGFKWRFWADPNTGLIDVSTFDTSISYVLFSPFGYVAFPGVGFGYMSSDIGQSDGQTKLLFYPFVDTKADFIAGNNLGARVIAGQQVASGWGLFFTDSVPVFMNGVFGYASPFNFDLTTLVADPSDKTFYVYVKNTNGVFSYSILAAPVSESNDLMFVGKIKTSSNSISSIEIVKTTRLGNVRISTSPIGASMPASVGVPSTVAGSLTGNLKW